MLTWRPWGLVAVPEMVDHVGHTEEREDEGAGPAVALPDEVAAGVPGLAKPLLCDGSVQLAVVPPGRGTRHRGWGQQTLRETPPTVGAVHTNSNTFLTSGVASRPSPSETDGRNAES